MLMGRVLLVIKIVISVYKSISIMNYHAMWFDIVALVDEVCARGRAPDQALFLTVLLC